MADSGAAANPVFADAHERTKKREQGGQGTWKPGDGLPDVYIAMGRAGSPTRSSSCCSAHP
jgi:hypothetical protein